MKYLEQSSANFANLLFTPFAASMEFDETPKSQKKGGWAA